VAAQFIEMGYPYSFALKGGVEAWQKA